MNEGIISIIAGVLALLLQSEIIDSAMKIQESFGFKDSEFARLLERVLANLVGVVFLVTGVLECMGIRF